MNFDSSQRQPCIVQPTPPADPRCNDPAFALANPDVCGAVGTLIIRPSLVSLCEMESVQFRVFEYLNLTEVEVTDECTFGTSNLNVFSIGVNGGAGTGLSTGVVTITATRNNKVARATVIVLPDDCCNDVTVASALVVDASRSMSTDFDGGVGGQYPSRLAYAKAVAAAYANNLVVVDGAPKDSVKVWSLTDEITAETAFLQDRDALQAAIEGISQGLVETDLLLAVTTAATDLLDTSADRKILVIISDGEDTINTERQTIIDAASDFKAAGGIIICIGVRAGGNGYDLLERICSIGFFLNGVPDTATETPSSDVIGWLAYWKDILCAGECIAEGDTYVNVAELDYSNFENWSVIEGQVNLLGPGLLDLQPGNGLYVELAGGSPAIIESIDSYTLDEDCEYRISFKLAGNQRVNIAGQRVKVYVRDVTAIDGDPNEFETVVTPEFDQEFETYAFAFHAPSPAVTVRLYFQQLYTGTAPTRGNLLDSVKFECATTGDILLEDEFDEENLVYIPPRCGPSAAIDVTDNPPEPDVTQAANSGDESEYTYFKYTYGYSWVTVQGETAVTPVVFMPDAPEEFNPRASRLVTLDTPPEEVIAVRLWRSLGEIHTITLSGAGDGSVDGVYIRTDGSEWNQDGGTHLLILEILPGPLISWHVVDESNPNDHLYSMDASGFPDIGVWTADTAPDPAPTTTITFDPDAAEADMFLLAEIPPGQTSYLDLEGKLEFEARYDNSVTAPTVNTTGVNQGELGFGYAYCCNYGDYDAFLASEDSPLVPDMTSNTTPSGVASDNPVTTFGFAYHAFDRDSATYWAALAEVDGGGNYVVQPWLQYEFSETPEAVTSYSITASDFTTENSPGRWVLQGSNNGAAWTTVDTQDGVFNAAAPGDWAAGETRTFDVASPGIYRFYRILIVAPTVTAGAGNNKNVNIAELRLMGAAETAEEQCDDCLDDPRAQLPDLEPTLDIEGEVEPVVTYQSTKNACFRCPDGFLSISATNVVFVTLTEIAAGAGPWSQTIQLSDPTQVVGHYELEGYSADVGDETLCGPKDFEFQGSNDGSTWTTLDEQENEVWFPGLVKRYYLQNQSTAYAYYRLVITEFACGDGVVDADFNSLTESLLHPKGATYTCIGATEQSNVSQSHADQLAFLTALQGSLDAFAASNACIQAWTRTVSYTATCANDDSGTGADVTASATYTSLISEAHALNVAQRIARDAAVAALVCA